MSPEKSEVPSSLLQDPPFIQEWDSKRFPDTPLGTVKALGPLDKNLKTPPTLTLDSEVEWDVNYAVEKWVIESAHKIDRLSSRIVELRELIESKQNGLTETEKKKIMAQTKEIMIRENFEVTAENMQAVAHSIIDKRKEFLSQANSEVSSLKNHLDELGDIPTWTKGWLGFFDADALRNLQNSIHETEERIRILWKSIIEY